MCFLNAKKDENTTWKNCKNGFDWIEIWGFSFSLTSSCSCRIIPFHSLVIGSLLPYCFSTRNSYLKPKISESSWMISTPNPSKRSFPISWVAETENFDWNLMLTRHQVEKWKWKTLKGDVCYMLLSAFRREVSAIEKIFDQISLVRFFTSLNLAFYVRLKWVQWMFYFACYLSHLQWLLRSVWLLCDNRHPTWQSVWNLPVSMRKSAH